MFVNEKRTIFYDHLLKVYNIAYVVVSSKIDRITKKRKVLNHWMK